MRSAWMVPLLLIATAGDRPFDAVPARRGGGDGGEGK